ncbi:MAG: DUF2461 family protein [Pseudomonadota bacterium]
MSGFGEETLSVLENLRANDSPGGFGDNRRIDNAAVRGAAKGFAGALAHLLEVETGRAHEHKIYRLHRDLRFPKDSTPCDTHIHMSARPVGGGAGRPAWMPGLEPAK